MPVTTRVFTQDELAAAMDAGVSATEFAARVGCTRNLVLIRMREMKVAWGEHMPTVHDIRWDNKLRAVPKRAAVLALLKAEGAHAVQERWGDPPSSVLKRARG